MRLCKYLPIFCTCLINSRALLLEFNPENIGGGGGGGGGGAPTTVQEKPGGKSGGGGGGGGGALNMVEYGGAGVDGMSSEKAEGIQMRPR